MKQLIFFAAIMALFTACNDDSGDVQTTDFTTHLTTAANEVIVKTYQAMDDKTALLVAATTALEADPTAQKLESARQAWRDARRPWEQAEGFLFGPVDQQGIDPAMDSWPVNEIDLDQVLASGEALTKTFIDAQEGTIKGFHTLEYLLFGKNSTKTVADFTPREFEYLRACGESLKGETAKLLLSWLPAGGNFSKNLLTAGTSSSIYPSQKSALNELVNGMITIADEVANGKINDPLTQENVTLEESRFSANSKADFADNMRSVRNIYFGSLDGSTGASLSSLIAAKNADLDQRVRVKIADAITGIEAIPGTFTTAIFEQKAAVIAAQTAVRNLQDILQGEVLTAVSGL